ncbi:MAG: radical SAM protein [Candidatus Omnitrophica bacterium]|nr:radical SAM protein [Candidatus Omnitrophota bacterium]
MKILRRNYSFPELYIFRKAALKILLNYRKVMNFILVELSLFFRVKRNLGLPFNILIEPTGDCNYQCIKCEQFTDLYADDGLVSGSKDMPFKNYRKIIDDIGDTLITLRLWNYGEPLMNNDIFLMIEYAKKKDIFVVLSSNLSLLGGDKSRKVVTSGLDYLIVSCDGASERTYKLCHGKDYFKRVINNIKALIGEKKNLHSELPFIELQFIVMKENENEINDISRIAKDLGVNKMTYLKLQADRLNIDKLGRFSSINELLPINKRFCYSSRERKRFNSCRIPWEETLIRYSGKVIPCCFDIGQLYAMGNLFQDGQYTGFKNIWNSQNYRGFRSQVALNLEALSTCQYCEKRDNNSNDQIHLA